ncbi:MAG: hypothetical protein Ct9H90mP15_02610 [Candidatus Neomarinimicrobiota bacterium]|nr:MAG: hypothetical protein Ct9H90mP15_02610 [Candidatus Neomarinimicrobiota bacterium]
MHLIGQREGGRFDIIKLYKKYPNDPYLANGVARSLLGMKSG